MPQQPAPRRRLRDKQLRERRVHPRYNDDEFALVRKAAALSRMQPGGYVAECALAAARADDPTAAIADYRAMVQTLMAANRQLGGIGNNLILRQRVRRAVAAAADETEFFALLEATDVNVRLKRGPSGDALGCNFALPGDTNDKGELVFYSGSTLAPDLSLPKIRRRLATTSPEPVTVRPGNPWHQATTATERIPHHLTHGDDPTGRDSWSRSGPH
ncbi:hypothetical protein [Streptomyces afghaniensis]|uniref:hypothetical protein n=1 Tax=Streptomyces afghaniensis TaxID=66865 RepID=UPI00358E54E3